MKQASVPDIKLEHSHVEQPTRNGIRARGVRHRPIVRRRAAVELQTAIGNHDLTPVSDAKTIRMRKPDDEQHRRTTASPHVSIEKVESAISGKRVRIADSEVGGREVMGMLIDRLEFYGVSAPFQG